MGLLVFGRLAALSVAVLSAFQLEARRVHRGSGRHDVIFW
jgi:hypothetical protein